MTRLAVLRSPAPTLREPSVEVPVSAIKTPRMEKLVADMVETMKLENGVGIAAPQVGVNERVIIVETGAGPEAFVNPVITRRSLRKADSEEGCLSVPGVYGIVKRHKGIRVEALNANGEKIALDVKGFPAIIFQHEIDHLDGILFVDRVERYTQAPKL
ncbi:peptide deformylase [Patescibacteria group bacterium]|nr:MAG: peptide deformylase [Patescibacteria group bacterium]